MNNENIENTSEYFPRKRIYSYLDDIELREMLINKELNSIDKSKLKVAEELSYISKSRQLIKQLLNAWENSEKAAKNAG